MLPDNYNIVDTLSPTFERGCVDTIFSGKSLATSETSLRTISAESIGSIFLPPSMSSVMFFLNVLSVPSKPG